VQYWGGGDNNLMRDRDFLSGKRLLLVLTRRPGGAGSSVRRPPVAQTGKPNMIEKLVSASSAFSSPSSGDSGRAGCLYPDHGRVCRTPGNVGRLRQAAAAGPRIHQTFNQYRDVLFGANRIIVVVHAKQGDIWNEKAMTKLYDLTQTLFFMPGVDRRTVTSLWTPNTRAVQITEEGMKAEDVIGGDVTVAPSPPTSHRRHPRAHHHRRLRRQPGGQRHSGAMVVAELADPDPATGKRLNYLEFSQRLEAEVRDKYADADFEVQIIGFRQADGRHRCRRRQERGGVLRPGLRAHRCWRCIGTPAPGC
jgi:hypothetical protein